MNGWKLLSPVFSCAPATIAASLLATAIPAPAGAAAPTWIDKAEDEDYTARHECSFVQAGDKFFLFGGREMPRKLDTYDFASDTWTVNASPPIDFNHFQATEYEGLVWVIGAFQDNSFPNEAPADSVYVYDPANDVWMQGTVIPEVRRRGSAGLVVHGGRFYVVAGNTIGHAGGYVDWFDEYDPRTGSWTPLASAPRMRDHFHAAVAGDKLYAVGGRLSGGPGGIFAPLIPEVDVYDFATGSWSTLPPASDLPQPRAASAVALFGGQILVIGGEGDGQAYSRVDAFDPTTGMWALLAPLNFARHGTQAIVSGSGVYVTAGSPFLGGGTQKNMEVYNADLPSGAPSVAGVLSVPPGATVRVGAPEAIRLEHVGGNVGVFVTEVSLSGSDAADFVISTDVSNPFLVPTAGHRDVAVEYLGAVAGATAQLDVVYSGGSTSSVALTGDPAAAPIGPAARWLLPALALLAGLVSARRAG